MDEQDKVSVTAATLIQRLRRHLAKEGWTLILREDAVYTRLKDTDSMVPIETSLETYARTRGVLQPWEKVVEAEAETVPLNSEDEVMPPDVEQIRLKLAHDLIADFRREKEGKK